MRATLVLFACLLVSTAFGVQVTISNASPRRDVNGNIMDIHDGNTLVINGQYYYYGASYGSCIEPNGDSGCAGGGVGKCGFRLDHNVSLYTSTDMSAWTFKSTVFSMLNFPVSGGGILYCPKILYNAQSKLYVMWFNWIAQAGFQFSYYAVAVSSDPVGPFKVVVDQVKTLAWNDTGDFALFQDDDGTAYIVYTSHIQGFATTHQMSVERLTPDYMATEGMPGNSGFFGQTFVEAPTMFKRNDVYYVLFGQCCCYCQGGSAVTVYTSSKPLGPFATGNSLGSNIPAQQTNVVAVKVNGGTQYLWQGDMWQSAPDKIKGHDLSYWGPMTFDSAGNIQALPFLKNFTLNVLPPM